MSNEKQQAKTNTSIDEKSLCFCKELDNQAEQLEAQEYKIMNLEDRITYLESALASMWFAYENKDTEVPHDFERQAIKTAEEFIGPFGGERFQELLCDFEEGEE